jgi:hypothetical protein
MMRKETIDQAEVDRRWLSNEFVNKRVRDERFCRQFSIDVNAFSSLYEQNRD